MKCYEPWEECAAKRTVGDGRDEMGGESTVQPMYSKTAASRSARSKGRGHKASPRETANEAAAVPEFCMRAGVRPYGGGQVACIPLAPEVTELRMRNSHGHRCLSAGRRVGMTMHRTSGGGQV